MHQYLPGLVELRVDDPYDATVVIDVVVVEVAGSLIRMPVTASNPSSV
jgi:hypothetical protein